MTVMIITNTTGSDILMESVDETVPASSTLEIDGEAIQSVAGDPSFRAAFAAGAITITLNGFSIPQNVLGSSLLSDICFGEFTFAN
jgi:hypothetical protein